MTSIITARVNKEDKEKFEAFCQSVGLTASAAINMFIKATIREGEIPFKIRTDPFYSKANQELLRKSVKQMEEKGGTVHDINFND